MAAASVDGYRTRGRSAFYQAMLYGYGMHAFMHLGSAAPAELHLMTRPAGVKSAAGHDRS
ncbi:hypothetical protein [Actinomyces sp.]|uniref:hypothetical protein n=1 Tax=Actinomyces sp. TaxID=29317 RepID=UPI0026DB8D76|nr:hypothetical protein [Actinomyces sp.]MDO4900361.1 hypothetical protein [Actinomyces sp.]